MELFGYEFQSKPPPEEQTTELTKMRVGNTLLTICLAAVGINALPQASAPVEDACPTKTEYACFDVINSSLCLSSNAAKGSAETLAKCVDFADGMSDLPGATKVRQESIRIFIQYAKKLHADICNSFVDALDVTLRQ